MASNVEIVGDNTALVQSLIADGIDRSLEMIGIEAERYAKEYLTESGAVDTGNLRNSVTHAIDSDDRAVYVGTNVEYAPFVELGTHRMKARPYLVPAASQHADEYREIIQSHLQE